MIRVIHPNGNRVDNSSVATPSTIGYGRPKKLKIAYLSNGKPNVGELFSFLDQQILEHNQEQVIREPFEIRFFEKKNAAKPASPEMLAKIKNYADLAIIGSAD